MEENGDRGDLNWVEERLGKTIGQAIRSLGHSRYLKLPSLKEHMGAR